MVKFLSEEPQNVTAWAKGSDGERRLAASGIWVIDAKNYTGLVEHLTSVDGSRQTPASSCEGATGPKTADGLGWQIDSVWVTWAKKLVEMIAEPGPLTPADVTHIANRLASALPPAFTAT